MEEIRTPDELFNGINTGGTPVMMTEDDAKVLSRALVLLNQRYAEEYDKIGNTPNVSELIQGAAFKHYNEMTEAGSKLHMALA